MKSVKVEDAVGMVLGHDITRIVRGQTKGRAFKKGHVIAGDDIEALLDLGKKHVFVWDLQEGYLHEDDAAAEIAAAASGAGILLSEPKEGKIELSAAYTGLLKIDIDLLARLNSLEQIMLATIHSNQIVPAGKKLAGTRIIPLVIKRSRADEAAALLRENGPLIQVKQLARLKIGIVTTGSEVYEGRIKDQFGPVLREKFTALGCEVMRQIIVPDDAAIIAASIKELIAEGAQLIATSGGMSVDPDDVTPQGIRRAGGTIVTYGAPVLPGAMFLLSFLGDVPVVGLPGCVMYHATTVFELVVPRLLAGETLAKKDFAMMGHGGLCAGCPECRYPECGFGK